MEQSDLYLWMSLIVYTVLTLNRWVCWSCVMCGFSYIWMLDFSRFNTQHIFQRACRGQHGTYIIWYPDDDVKLLKSGGQQVRWIRIQIYNCLCKHFDGRKRLCSQITTDLLYLVNFVYVCICVQLFFSSKLEVLIYSENCRSLIRYFMINK